jgi:uncharacterized protein YutE (UPF0331/DUF86 family)
MVDPSRIEEKFRQLDGFLEVLRQLGEIPPAELAGDQVRIGSAKYYLLVSIECCLDVANHVIASEGFRPPRDYADTFTVLAEKGVLPDDFAERLRSMAKFRNRLVHLYSEIDDRQITRFMREGLGDFTRFKGRIIKLLAHDTPG